MPYGSPAATKGSASPRRQPETPRLNLPRLRAHGIEFIHIDIRNAEDVVTLRPDLIIECSAEPSVLAGYGEGSEYAVRTNLFG